MGEMGGLYVAEKADCLNKGLSAAGGVLGVLCWGSCAGVLRSTGSEVARREVEVAGRYWLGQKGAVLGYK